MFSFRTSSIKTSAGAKLFDGFSKDSFGAMYPISLAILSSRLKELLYTPK